LHRGTPMDRALIFDCDGVLADTELYGHLPAFNQMWEKMGVPWQWSKQQYGEKLKIGGGKERMASLFAEADFRDRVAVPESEEERKALLARWHKEKTAIYEGIISSGKIPTRPGIKRLSEEALQAGWKLAVASTSAPGAVAAVLRRAVGDELAREFLVLSGDIVPAKKPAPDIYLLALERLQLPAEDCIAIEDSRNGMLAACGAHIPVVVTVAEYTSKEDFHEAALVVDSLGDPQGPKSKVLASRNETSVADYVKLEDLALLLERSTAGNAKRR
jgi:HAD superfamily hydrolase (TIGR01509 family)